MVLQLSKHGSACESPVATYHAWRRPDDQIVGAVWRSQN